MRLARGAVRGLARARRLGTPVGSDVNGEARRSCDQVLVPAVGVHKPDVPVALERDPLAVWRPLRSQVVLHARQLLKLAVSEGESRERWMVADDDPVAVGGDVAERRVLVGAESLEQRWTPAVAVDDVDARPFPLVCVAEDDAFAVRRPPR